MDNIYVTNKQYTMLKILSNTQIKLNNIIYTLITNNNKYKSYIKFNNNYYTNK